MHPEASGFGAESEGPSSSDAPRPGEALLADLLANTTELLSFYDRDFNLTHYATRLKGVYGGVVAPGAAVWEIYPSFLDAMGRLFGELTRVLRPGRYALVIVRDAYQNGRYQFVGADLAGRAGDAGLVPKGDLIWHQAGTRLRPYGYPRVFVPNIAHQHILVLRREPAGSGSAGSRQARRRLSR